jgi:hypothetical protein
MKKNHKPLLVLIAFLFVASGTTGAFAQESGSAIAVGGPPQILNGEIRWKKALGTVPFVAGLSAAHSDPCSAFYVLVVTADEEQTLITYNDKLSWKPQDGAFNICKFTITVSSNTPIRVYAMMGRKSGATEQQMNLYLYGGWSGGEKIPWDYYNYGAFEGRNYYPGNLIDPQPATGNHREVVPRSRELSLSPTMPSLVKFEMVYLSNTGSNYLFSPRYKEPAPPPLKPPFITGQVILQPFLPFASAALGWDGGPDHPNAEVWLSVDNSAETLAFKQPKGGATEQRLQRGSSYSYVLKDAGKTLSKVLLIVPRY